MEKRIAIRKLESDSDGVWTSSRSVRDLNVLSQHMHFHPRVLNFLDSAQCVASSLEVLCFARASASPIDKYHKARRGRYVAKVQLVWRRNEHVPEPVPVPAARATCQRSPARKCVGRKMKEGTRGYERGNQDLSRDAVATQMDNGEDLFVQMY